MRGKGWGLAGWLVVGCAPGGDLPTDDTDVVDTEETDDTEVVETDDTEETDDTDVSGTEVTVVTCPDALPASAARCDVTAGDARLLLRGTVLAPDTVYEGGAVLVAADGTLACVGCDCLDEAAGATVVSCGDGVISPGLINAHDHLTFAWTGPVADDGERYEHRHDWRLGVGEHDTITVLSNASQAQVRWAELRHLLAGTTSIAGSGGQAGLVRNLDRTALQEGLDPVVSMRMDTFPLGDANGTRRTSGCDYPDLTTSAEVASSDAWLPGVAVGIDAAAHNELACLTGASGGEDVVDDRTALLFAQGLDADDLALLADRGAGIVWTPRSDHRLYGRTFDVLAARRLGVRVALGTDWPATGSMNLARELACAASYDDTLLGDGLTDADLWRMVTGDAASLTGVDDRLGRLDEGYLADVVVFDGSARSRHAAVVQGEAGDVVLLLRAGKALYGDAALVTALRPGAECDTVEVCEVDHAVCLKDEIGLTWDALHAGAGVTYLTFTCDTPPDEPTCVPARSASVAGSTVYDGVPTGSDGDGDGVPDASDLCPTVFDPVRPMDAGVPSDVDGDGLGDACDPCPTAVACP